MSQRRNIFLPPILQVLEEGQSQHICTEGVSNVIKWIDIDPVQHSTPDKRPQTPLSHLMKTIDLRYGDPVRDGEEQFSYIVCFPEDDKDDTDTQAKYTQRTVTNRASSQKLAVGVLWKKKVIYGLKKAARKIRSESTTSASVRESNSKV